MSNITRHGPRFTFLIGFDLGKPSIKFVRFVPGHYALTIAWLEFHFMFGTGRDRTLDIIQIGIDTILERNSDEYFHAPCS